MHSRFHVPFIQAIHDRKKVRITFVAIEDDFERVRLCAPLDFGPKRKAKDQRNRYHLWDYESDNGYHPLSLFTEQIVHIEFLNDMFDTNFIVWQPNWLVNRDWGIHS